MKIFVLGAGDVGYGIANYLSNQGEEVIVVEKSPEIAAKIKKNPGINVVIGNATNPEILKESKPENADYVIATMPNDEQNIIACKLMGSLFEVQTKIARLRSQTFLQNNDASLQFFRENFSVDVIVQPELKIANAVCDIAEINGAFEVVNLKNSLIIGLKCPPEAEVLNTPFRHFRGIVDFDASVLTITRNGNTSFPQMDDVLLENDEIYLAVSRKHKNKVLKLFGYEQKNYQNILIVGSNSIGMLLLKTMGEKKSEITLTLLEESVKSAEEIAQNFPAVTVSCENYLNYEFLREISREIDVAIVSTNREKTNVLSSLFLKKFGVKKVLTLAKNHRYDLLLPVSDGCTVINPSAITIETILRSIRKKNIASVTALKNNANWVVVETPVTELCARLGKGVMSIAAKDKILPIFISRNNSPEAEKTGSSLILAEKNPNMIMGDVVTLLVEKNAIWGVEKIFSSYQFLKDKILS
ncbi:MAG: NAD-binding protein [Holosporaceae bacterium]|jgi:trk system potassium uptake protein TrkA|nr:NAD-binding protein [Holosporaceae bacterium]